MTCRSYLLVALVALASPAVAWPFGPGGGKAAEAQAGAGVAVAGMNYISAEEIRQAQAMMNDPRFLAQMTEQLKDPTFMSQLRASLASPEARAQMEKMGMRLPSEAEIAQAMDKLQSPEFQAQLRARVEAAAAAQEQQGGSMMGRSRLSQSKVDASAGAEKPALSA